MSLLSTGFLFLESPDTEIPGYWNLLIQGSPNTLNTTAPMVPSHMEDVLKVGEGIHFCFWTKNANSSFLRKTKVMFIVPYKVFWGLEKSAPGPISSHIQRVQGGPKCMDGYTDRVICRSQIHGYFKAPCSTRGLGTCSALRVQSCSAPG